MAAGHPSWRGRCGAFLAALVAECAASPAPQLPAGCEYLLGESGSNCPEGETALNFEECKAAAGGDPLITLESRSKPAGCFVHDDVRYYNKDSEGVPSESSTPVCRSCQRSDSAAMTTAAGSAAYECTSDAPPSPGQLSTMEFRCYDGLCLSTALYCDGRKDCADGSDELHCSAELGPTTSIGATNASLVDSGGAGEEPTEPYDCRADFADWEQSWSSERRDWCCEHYGGPCAVATPSEEVRIYDCHQNFETWQHSWEPEKKRWCCESEHIGCEPYDCPEDESGEAANLDDSRKALCCLLYSRLCPVSDEEAASNEGEEQEREEEEDEENLYDCEKEVLTWRLSWTPQKQEWCCQNHHLGCPRPQRPADDTVIVAHVADAADAPQEHAPTTTATAMAPEKTATTTTAATTAAATATSTTTSTGTATATTPSTTETASTASRTKTGTTLAATTSRTKTKTTVAATTSSTNSARTTTNKTRPTTSTAAGKSTADVRGEDGAAPGTTTTKRRTTTSSSTTGRTTSTATPTPKATTSTATSTSTSTSASTSTSTPATSTSTSTPATSTSTSTPATPPSEASATTRAPTLCSDRDYAYLPLDMIHYPLRQVQDEVECKERCASVEGCAHYSYWRPARHCHLAGVHSRRFKSALFQAGPPVCDMESEEGAISLAEATRRTPIAAQLRGPSSLLLPRGGGGVALAACRAGAGTVLVSALACLIMAFLRGARAGGSRCGEPAWRTAGGAMSSVLASPISLYGHLPSASRGHHVQGDGVQSALLTPAAS